MSSLSTFSLIAVGGVVVYGLCSLLFWYGGLPTYAVAVLILISLAALAASILSALVVMFGLILKLSDRVDGWRLKS